MRYLKENTATRITVGPFYDVTDGITPEIALTVTNCLLTFVVDDAGVPTLVLDVAPTASGGANDMVHITSDAAGYYDLELAAANVNYTGRATLSIHDTDVHLPVFHEFQIVSANVYDSLFTDGDLLDVNVGQWLGTAAATPTTAGVPEIELARISGQTVTAAAAVTVHTDLGVNSTAQSALEDQFDGTGLSGDAYPSTQSQLAGISNVGSATHVPFSGETLTTPATTTSGSYTDTEALDGTYMNWDTVTGGFEAELTGNIGAGIPSGIKITGYMNGANDAVRVQMWDYQAGTPAFVTIGSWSGGGSTVNQVLPYDAFIGMVGTGANLGDVRLRLYNDNGVIDTALTSANIYIDQAFVEFSASSGEVLDAVYYDSDASNTGTTSVDGTPGNPVSTEAAVNTLLTKRNLKKVIVALESSITFATSHIDEIWEGTHWTLANGGQNLSGSHFVGAVVTGTASASIDPIDYMHCRFGTCSLPQFHIMNSSFMTGTVTLNEAGDYVIADSHSSVAGDTTPIIDTGAAIANVNLSMPNYQQGIEIANLNATGADKFSISGMGQIIYSASSSGAVNQRGRWKLTNTGGVTITYDDPSQNEIDTLVDTNELQTNQGNWLTATGFSTHSAANVRTEMDSNSTQLAAIAEDTASIGITKNATFSNLEFLMVDATDHVTPETGLTVAGTMSIDGAAFAAVNGTIAEVSNGIYQIDLTADDTNGDVITYRFTSAGAADTFVTIKTRA